MQIRKVIDDMVNCVTKMVKYWTESRISLEISQQCSSNLAPEIYIVKETKWHLRCCCPVLIKIEVHNFCLNQVPSTDSNQMRRVKTILEPCLLRARVGNGDIWFLTERDWSQESCHGNGTIGVNKIKRKRKSGKRM